MCVYYHVLKSVSIPTADFNPNGVMVPVSERIGYKTALCTAQERQLLFQHILLNNQLTTVCAGDVIPTSKVKGKRVC